MKALLETLRRAVGLPEPERPAINVALYGPHNAALDLVNGIEWILRYLKGLGLPEAEWITLNYGGVGNRQYKTYKLSSWVKRGKPLPDETLTSIEVGRFISKERQGLTDYVWTSGISTDVDFLLCVDRNTEGIGRFSADELVCAIQDVTAFEYGYVFEMPFQHGPDFFIDGSTLSTGGRNFFTRYEEEEIAKWSHARRQGRKFDLAVSDLIRDVFPKNFLNAHHLSMQIKDQSLRDWINTDPRHGTLKPLIEDKLWVWDVPKNRIGSIRKVLGKKHLLISWGDFNMPSGGPVGHTYGSKQAEQSPFNGLALSEEEQHWIADGLAAMAPIFEGYTGEKFAAVDRFSGRLDPRFPELLDAIFTAWSQDANSGRPTPEQVEQAFAATLGEYLIKRYGMVWYTVEDEYGRSLGVCHRGKGDAQTWTYPIDVIAKRIDRKETGFIPGVVEAIGNEIERG